MQDRRPASIDPALSRALAALRAGAAVVYPTETFYALGVDALSPAALQRLFAIKEREPGKPVALIAADAEMAFGVAREVPPQARILADAFWPGPLTLVLPAREGIDAALVNPEGGVGVRVSPHPIARALAAGLGRPLTATSANLAGAPPAVELDEARCALGAKVKIYLDGGRLPGGAPSSVVVADAVGIRVFRPGAITEEQITAALGRGSRK
ncbi:MAG TPA: L-threonylcarbamoyladenylate synthase [Candidatus Binataceae bacterium]|nr:L-threonylcarbamoyladenylate synthase [Candidatus Binataceae bacterium]